MEIKIGTKQILTLLNILSWIIFIATCVEAGGILFNSLYVLYKPTVAKYFWNGADLSALIAHDKGHFFTQIILVTIVAVMKALIFYLIITLFYDKKFSLDKPFHPGVNGVIFKIAWLCLGAGLFSNWGVKYAVWIEKQGIEMPDISVLHLDGADVWLFMAVVLMVIGQVFKKGIELQTESELTV
ncbi:MAG: DUF2975 domain-containing protein [Chitinophagaceae bacterium]|nr:DUF2975 domain-containing protein [Chitinophagaceae bacterium]